MAGIVAVIGQWFGIGCGSNYDMTYSGARNWLYGIPLTDRGVVHYYTTSFTDRPLSYDFCHFFTDLLLADPDDGVTEKDKGQLTGGNNAGHKTGHCHVADMRDPPQFNDSSRDSEMDTNAKY